MDPVCLELIRLSVYFTSEKIIFTGPHKFRLACAQFPHPLSRHDDAKLVLEERVDDRFDFKSERFANVEIS
jgi:hypothetical protein